MGGNLGIAAQGGKRCSGARGGRKLCSAPLVGRGLARRSEAKTGRDWGVPDEQAPCASDDPGSRREFVQVRFMPDSDMVRIERLGYGCGEARLRKDIGLMKRRACEHSVVF